MSFVAVNDAFEIWLRRKCDVVQNDLDAKHCKMAKSAFDFLRATYFRWAGEIAALCPGLAASPAMLCVGDIHVENYGTWRDADGRWVWGVNDFDEAAVTPFAFDLLRLAVSAELAPDARVVRGGSADQILQGYREGLANPRPALLDETLVWMRAPVSCPDDKCVAFWNEVKGYPATGKVPDEVVSGFSTVLPEDASITRFATRAKGGGSLGRPRYVAIANWRGGQVIREAKALVPSAWDWAHGHPNADSHFEAVSKGRYRSPDPFLRVLGAFIFRRIAPDSRKLDFGPELGLEPHQKSLRAMGFDLAAVHLDSGSADSIGRFLSQLPSNWLHSAVEVATDWVKSDHREW
jgi:hypothetical protein